MIPQNTTFRLPLPDAALRFHPIVFLYENQYRIMVWTVKPVLMWVQIGGQTYYDDACGVLRSATPVHRMTVPQQALDQAGSYTLYFRRIENREPYHADTKDAVSVTYPFFPIAPGSTVRACQITDSHGSDEVAVKAGEAEAFDLLLLTGDLQDHMQTTEEYAHMYRIASALAGGRIPVLYARGNHDCRGAAAELFDRYTPLDADRGYYYACAGDLCFLILDCGEDKPDTNDEYSGTICFAPYREMEESFLKNLLTAADFPPRQNMLNLVISHTPFPYTKYPPFDIEVERYTRWLRMLKASFAPQLFISGHLHHAQFSPIGGELDCKGQICPLVVGSDSPGHGGDGSTMTVTFYRFSTDEITIRFINESHKIKEIHTITTQY